MTRQTKSKHGTCTVWINDGSDNPPKDSDNFWVFRSSHGICMITKNFPSIADAKNVIGTVLVLLYDKIGFLESVDQIN